MSSSEEEAIEPIGFSLNFKKCNRSKNRIKNTGSFFSLQQDQFSSTSTHDEKTVDNKNENHHSSAKKGGSTKPTTGNARKRSRKDILASISANAKSMTIPIPSFNMMAKRRKNSRSEKLSRLERAFFDDDDEEENDAVASGSRVNGGRASSDAENNNRGAPGAGKSRKQKLKRNSTVSSSLVPAEKLKAKIVEKDERTLPILRNQNKIESNAAGYNNPEGALTSPAIQNQHRQIQDDTKEQSTTRSSTSIQEDGQTATNIADVINIAGTRERAGNSVQTSIPLGQGFNENSTEENPESEVYNKEDNGYTIFVGDDDSDGIAGDNHEGQPSVNFRNEERKAKLETTTKASPTKPAEVCQDVPQASPTSDLERQIDLLFMNSDTNSITMNIFYKTLESQRDTPLEKNTKKKIKARVMSLLKGEIKPSVDVVPVSNICVNQDKIEDEKMRKQENDSTAKDDMILEKDINSAKDPNNNINIENENQKVSNVNNNSLPEPRSIVEERSEVEILECGPKPVVRKKENKLDQQQAEVTDTSEKLYEHDKSVPCTVQVEKDVKKGSENQAKSEASNLKTKRQRKSKPKLSGGGNKSDDIGTALKPEKKVNQTRKRPRKAAACALCKTCPCQRAHTYSDNENVVTLDVKTFSRSDEAVERTLVRRLQKLEKSTESLEEQTETVRRRLKKHRRDIWKRQQRELLNTNNAVAGGRTADSYFLPDAEIFERQQNESQGLPRRVVEKAQKKIFQNVPTYQPTLFELMGVSRDSDNNKQNAGSEMADNEGHCDEKTGMTCRETILFDTDANARDDGDENECTEYVPEKGDDDKIYRLEWDNDAKDVTGEEKGVASGSIFDMIPQMTQIYSGGIDNGNTGEDEPLPLWDDLFESKVKDDEKPTEDAEAGLDDLLCLFEEGDADSKRGDSCSTRTTEDEHRVELSLLSQGAQEVAKGVISKFSTEEVTAEALGRSYPNWKENIYFALIQKDPDKIQEALHNLQQSRMRMQAQKEQLLKAWECKNVALDVFETALKKSFARSNSKNGSSIPQE